MVSASLSSFVDPKGLTVKEPGYEHNVVTCLHRSVVAARNIALIFFDPNRAIKYKN